MKTIRLNLKKRSYNIIVGSNLIARLGKHLKGLKLGQDAYIITNPAVKRLYGKKVRAALKKDGFSVRFKCVPDTEKSKSIKVVNAVIADLSQYDRKKKILIIALGGGVVGDLAGFVASIYKRGIDYIQIPTTLLAQVDSSIGGKTAVDLLEGKNLIGAFYQPRLVLSDVTLLSTLDKRQTRCGLSEVIKYGIIKDPVLFVYLEKNFRRILDHKRQPLEFIVSRCSRIKAGVVKMDEREEKGIRTILNFGHTIGHAIEKAAGFKGYNHGEAVAIGMLCAAEISQRLGLVSPGVKRRIEALIKAVGLPVKIKKLMLKSIIEAHYRDKKFRGARNRFVLITAIGRTKITEGVPLEVIKGILKKRS
ncbi:3-dehydroquinate synthase [Candidatus Omnitrophota bacterium]